MSNTGRGKGKKGNAPPQDYATMSHHIGGISHSQPQHISYTVPAAPIASVEMTMTNPNEMNQSNYNVTPNLPPQQRRNQMVQMTLPPTAQLQQDANTNGSALYTVNIPRHGHGHLSNHPAHMMSQPPPPQQPYQYYPQMQYPQGPFATMPLHPTHPPPYQPQPQRTQPPLSSRPKKVLKISDPETKCVINEKEVATSASVAAPVPITDNAAVPVVAAPVTTAAAAPVEQAVSTDNAVKPAPVVAAEPVPSRTANSVTTAIQQRFRAEVTNRALGNSATTEAKEEVTQEVPKPVEEQPEPVVAVQPEPAPQQVPVVEAPIPEVAPVSSVVEAESVPAVPEVVPEAAPEVVAVAAPVAAPVAEVPAIPEVTVAEPVADDESVQTELSRQTSEAPQEDDRSPEEKQAALVKKHEEKITLLRDGLSVNLMERIYSRTYMYAIRDVVSELSICKCKLSEEELKKFGLDRASMPNQPENKKRHEPGFLPQWIGEGNQGGQRRPAKYGGRGSDSGGRYPQRNKKNLPTRPSIERTHKTVEPSHKAEKAWKPVAKIKDLDETTKTFKDIRGLLNKVTPTSYPEISNEFIKFEVYKTDEVRSSVIDIIFDKAVEEPKFCPLYSDLCKLQTNTEFEQSQSRLFRDGILQKCQKTFEADKNAQEQKLKEEIENETDDKKRKELQDSLQEITKKEKRRVIGNIGFISQLYRHNLITPSILNWCVVHLLRSDQENEGGDEESLECAVKMITCVGKTWEQSGKDTSFPLDKYVSFLNSRGNDCSNRVRFMVVDLIDLMNRNWIPRKGADTGPKTITEIQREARNEEMQNKVERDNYNERRGLGNSRSKDYSQSGRRNYGGRPSDKRLPGNMVNVGPIDRSLKKCEPQTSLSSQKNWSGGAGGGGVQGSSSLKSNKGFQSLTAAVRGNDSQNSSREQSESRKNSLAARAPKPVEATNGASPSLSAKELEAKLQEVNKKIVNGVRNDLNEYMEQAVTINEVFESIQDRCSDHSIPEVFMNFIAVGGDETKPDKRKHLGQMLARCLSEKEMRDQALVGITAYCSYVVRFEVWEETGNVWDFVADVFRHAILCDSEVFEGARPSIADFDSAFLAANGDQRKPYRLLISLLQKLINDDDHMIASMAFLELKEEFRNEPGLRAALEQEKTNGSQHTNLYALLNAQ